MLPSSIEEFADSVNPELRSQFGNALSYRDYLVNTSSSLIHQRYKNMYIHHYSSSTSLCNVIPWPVFQYSSVGEYLQLKAPELRLPGESDLDFASRLIEESKTNGNVLQLLAGYQNELTTYINQCELWAVNHPIEFKAFRIVWRDRYKRALDRYNEQWRELSREIESLSIINNLPKQPVPSDRIRTLDEYTDLRTSDPNIELWLSLFDMDPRRFLHVISTCYPNDEANPWKREYDWYCHQLELYQYQVMDVYHCHEASITRVYSNTIQTIDKMQELEKYKFNGIPIRYSEGFFTWLNHSWIMEDMSD